MKWVHYVAPGTIGLLCLVVVSPVLPGFFPVHRRQPWDRRSGRRRGSLPPQHQLPSPTTRGALSAAGSSLARCWGSSPCRRCCCCRAATRGVRPAGSLWTPMRGSARGAGPSATWCCRPSIGRADLPYPTAGAASRPLLFRAFHVASVGQWKLLSLLHPATPGFAIILL
jgi:hypothetical protein